MLKYARGRFSSGLLASLVVVFLCGRSDGQSFFSSLAPSTTSISEGGTVGYTADIRVNSPFHIGGGSINISASGPASPSGASHGLIHGGTTNIFNGSFQYFDNGSFQVTLTGGGSIHNSSEATVFSGSIPTRSFTVNVANVAPQNFTVFHRNASTGGTMSTNFITINEGETIERTAQASDPGAQFDPLTFTLNGQFAGTNSSSTTGLRGSNNVSQTYLQDTDGGIAASALNSVSDGDGGVTTSVGPQFVILNVAPTISSTQGAGNITLQEGHAVGQLISALDPGADTLAFVIGGGLIGTSNGSPGVHTSPFILRSFASDGTYDNTFQVFDDDAGSTAIPGTITVTNFAPIVWTATQNGANDLIFANEGDTVSLQMQSLDFGADAQSFFINGDAAGVGSNAAGTIRTSSVVNRTFAQDGGFDNTFTVFDDDTSTTATRAIFVLNVAPTIESGSINAGSFTIPEGLSFFQRVESSDPGADTHSFTIGGINAGVALNTSGTRLSNVILRSLPDDGFFDNTFTATDDDVTTSRPGTITAYNVDPTHTAFTLNSNRYRAGSGTSLVATLSATDPGSDAVDFEINGAHAGGLALGAPGSTRTVNSLLAPLSGPRGTSVTLNSYAYDDDGGSSGILSQTVDIVGPVFTSSIAPNSIIDVGDATPGNVASFVLNIQNTTPDGDLDGLTDLTIHSGSFISGADADDFEILGLETNQVIPAGGSLDLIIQFTPDLSLGDKVAMLTLLTDQNAGLTGLSSLASGDQFTFQLFATAVPEPASFLVWLAIGATAMVLVARSRKRSNRR